jgi:hypothetical protein
MLGTGCTEYQLLVNSPDDIQVIEPSVRSPFELTPTQIGELLQYSGRVKSGHRLMVKGWVTMAGRDFLYIQDDSGGVEVQGDHASLQLGDLVEAAGYPSLLGRYSPVITDAVVRSLDRKGATLARAATVESILQGQYDSQLVSIEGKLLAAFDGPTGKSLLLQSGIHTFAAELNTADLGGESVASQRRQRAPAYGNLFGSSRSGQTVRAPPAASRNFQDSVEVPF